MSRFKIWRWMIGGIWYRHEMTGELPNCYGGWWSRDKEHHPRFEKITKIENYASNELR